MTHKTNLKLSVLDYIRFKDLKEIVEFMQQKGYACILVDNGNIVFEKEDTE